MIRYSFITLLNQARNSPGLYLLTVAGVTLGVASVLAIQIINVNAIAAFEATVQTLSGEADLVVRGSAPTLPESLLPAVLSTSGVSAAWPVLSFPVFLPEYEVNLEILGLDLVTPVPGRSLFPDDGKIAVEKILGSPGWMLIDERLADRMGWSNNQRIRASVGSQTIKLLIGDQVDFRRLHPHASPRTAVMDIAAAQQITKRPGRLSRINVTVEEDPTEVKTRLRDRLPSSVYIESPREQEREAAGLLTAFRLNLTALSLISLFVGLFLVYTSTQAMLVRRRTEFGILRSLGATRLQVFRHIAIEVLLLGLSGVLLGLPLGYWLAQSNLQTVNSTLTSVYLLQEIEQLQLPSYIYFLGVLIGLGGTLLGALLPTVDLSRADPRSLLSRTRFHQQTGSAARPLFWIGIALLTLGFSVAAGIGFEWKPSGFVLGIAVLLSIPMLAPLLVQVGSRKIKATRFGFLYSFKSLADRLATTSFTAAALAVAVAMLVGITLMVGSFRKTVEVWIESSIVADVYVTAESWEGPDSPGAIEASLVRQLVDFDGIEAIDRLRSFTLELFARPVIVVGADMGSHRSWQRYPLARTDSKEPFEKLQAGKGVLISEPLAIKQGLSPGNLLRIPTARGTADLPILAVTYDYSSDSGVIVMSLDLLQDLYGLKEPNSLALYGKTGVDGDELAAQLTGEFQDVPLRFSSNQQLRSGILEIFDQTFSIVRLLQFMSLLIAIFGIMLTLLILSSERASEVALYRALGASRTQILKIFLGKGGAIGLVGLLIGSIAGGILAWILIFIVNRAYFGWTIQFYPPWRDLVSEIVLILSAALAASFYPAIKASQAPATELTRDDL